MTAMGLLSDNMGFEISARARRKSKGLGHGATFGPVQAGVIKKQRGAKKFPLGDGSLTRDVQVQQL